MTEQTAPGVGGDQIEFPGCIQFEQRLPPEASPQGNGARRDVFTGRSPAGDSTEFAASARLIAAADDAKRRIERDLHDGLQQRLVSLGLRARLAEASVSRHQQELKCELALIAEGLLEALETLREISRGIHPAILSERGLGPAVETLARRVNALAGTMQLVSPRGHGTRLRVRLPIRPDQLDCGTFGQEHYELESANGRGADPGTGGGDPHCLPADERHAPKSLARQR
jgi:signal transduction histidine kinase